MKVSELKPSNLTALPLYFSLPSFRLQIDIDLGMGGGGRAVVLGSDLTHEYVAENADYRS